jgi:lysyl-tRNA synthetase class 1
VTKRLSELKLHLPENIILNSDLHKEERGILPYGGLGPCASCIFYKGERIRGATLPQRDIYLYKIKPTLEGLQYPDRKDKSGPYISK